MLEKKNYEPKIVAFCCNWCSYAGADGAGTARKHYPANIKIIKVPCSCRVIRSLSCARFSVARTVSSCAAVTPVIAIIRQATIMHAVV